MRIIGGKYKSRTIPFNKKIKARPTTDSAKEALFNILENRISLDKIKVLDLFAGTGNIAYEFISRGAFSVNCIDQQINAIKFINQQANKWEMNIKPYKANVYSFLEKKLTTFDIIFADPPYDDKKTIEIPEIIFKKKLLNKDGWLILEHGKNIDFHDCDNFEEQRTYSSVNFSFFKNQNDE
jgi:16S rRNA (guanine(966)-N(2))-methyltransferase RsmD